MPFIRISVGASELCHEQVRALQSRTTELMATVLGKKAPLTAVQVHRTDPGAWSVGGQRVSVCAHVEATITAGTNTSDEKARFIEEEMSLLRSVLGSELKEATYVVLQEVSAMSWGYGGRTQEDRARRAQAAA